MSDRAVPRRGFDTLTRWLLGAQCRSHRGRALVAMLTIALGVGLGYAVQLINGAAFNGIASIHHPGYIATTQATTHEQITDEPR